MAEIRLSPEQASANLTSYFKLKTNLQQPAGARRENTKAVSKMFFPAPSLLKSWTHNPETHEFSIKLKEAHDKGNNWITYHFSPRVAGHFEAIDDKFHMVIDQGIRISAYHSFKTYGYSLL